MEKRAKKIQVLVDLGRIPSKIATGKGFSGYTADQWRSFIMIYATPIMWDLLDEADRKILANFVRALARLIEENYGQEKITPNIHLSLHIVECYQDYRPLYSFWCYSFERMNSVLGSLPNSKHTIELELFLISAQSDNAKLMNALPLVQSRLTTGSLAAYDGFDFNELYHFMQNFHQNIDNTITTVKYYNDIYDWNFTSIADLASSDLLSGDSNQSIIVLPIVTQFGCIQIVPKFLDQKVHPDIKEVQWASKERKPKDSRSGSGGVGFRPSGKEEPRFVLTKIRLWASEERKPKDKDSFGWASEERKPKIKICKFGWASKEQKPKDKDSFGWASEE
ncbi:hypothetical protein RhiirB3_453864 [Rhizophagus irregularis]|nr:hypothetical protein RhiirB3_453864 [Rhizophagus irregularis]